MNSHNIFPRSARTERSYRRQIHILALQFTCRLRFSRFTLLRFERITPLLKLDRPGHSNIFGSHRRPHNSAGCHQPQNQHDGQTSHDNIRSSSLIRCSTRTRAVPPICALRSIAA